MTRSWRLLGAFLRQLLWLAALGTTWVVLATERLLELHEGALRTALLGLGTVSVVGVSFWAARRFRRSLLRFLPLVLLAAVAAREWQRLELRRHYRAEIPPGRPADAPILGLTHPVTTTDLVVRHHALTSDRLSVERLRLVLLTDLHVNRALPRAYYEHVLAVVAGQHADLILLTGDYVSKPENIELMAQLFSRHWPARYGAFAVLGNHDFWSDPARVRTALRAGGVSLVGGRCERLPGDIGRVAVCGTEKPWGPDLSTPLDRSLLNVALSHTPDNVYRLAQQGASIVLSGHTHGGQIRLPGLGSLVVPSRYGRLFDEGHFRVAGADLFVSAGVGAEDPALRLYCRPEILVIDITRP